jgi:hypothetical protein
MATGTIANTIKQTGWGDRKSELFIDGVMRSANFLNKMTIIDGVKSKAQIPVYAAELNFGNDFCNIAQKDGSYKLLEKEVRTNPHTWYFSECQNALFETYRSKMLRKGVLNEQTFDDDFLEWLFDYFAKRVGEYSMDLAYNEIKAACVAGTTNQANGQGVTIVSTSASITDANILDTLETMYKAFSQDMIDSYMSQTDEEYKPVIYMNARMIQYYQIAMSKKYTTTPVGIIEGAIPGWMGFKVECWHNLADGEILITPPANMLIITDDFGDSKAIQTEYDTLTSTDQFFGKFMLGFDIRREDLVVCNFKSSKAASK